MLKQIAHPHQGNDYGAKDRHREPGRHPQKIESFSIQGKSCDYMPCTAKQGNNQGSLDLPHALCVFLLFCHLLHDNSIYHNNS